MEKYVLQKLEDWEEPYSTIIQYNLVQELKKTSSEK